MKSHVIRSNQEKNYVNVIVNVHQPLAINERQLILILISSCLRKIIKFGKGEGKGFKEEYQVWIRGKTIRKNIKFGKGEGFNLRKNIKFGKGEGL